MRDLREVNPSNDPASDWLNSAREVVRKQKVSRSSDLVVKTGPAGTSLSIREEYKNPPHGLNYRGQWNYSASYQVNDVVFVPSGSNMSITGSLSWLRDGVNDPVVSHDGTYNIQKEAGKYILSGSKSGVPYTMTFDLTIGFFNPDPGTYVCVAPVPSLDYFFQLYNQFIGTPSTLWATDITFTTIPKPFNADPELFRLYDVNYYPSASISGPIATYDSNNLTLEKGRYWEPIGGGGSSGGGSAGSTLLVWL